MRSPFAKSVGVLLTASLRPTSRTLSTGFAQLAAHPGPSDAGTARLSHALARSGEHHTAREWSAFSGPDHGVHEDVDRDVVELGEHALELRHAGQ